MTPHQGGNGMRSQSQILAFSLFAWLVAPCVGVAQGNWKESKNSDGIQVFSRQKVGSPFAQVKATLKVKAEPEAVLPHLLDIENQKNWVAECKESSVVGQRTSAFDFFVYNRIGIPWPFEDRDTVFRSKVRKLPENSGYVVFLRSVQDPKGPSPKSVVRMGSFEGQWLLERLPGKAGTLIDFRVHLEPGGNLTSVFVNSTASSLQFKTLDQLKQRLSETETTLVTAPVPEIGPIDPTIERP